MAEQRMRSFEMTEIVTRGLDECLTEAFEIALDECDGIFLSVDIDVCDPGHAPGTGTPEPGVSAVDNSSTRSAASVTNCRCSGWTSSRCHLLRPGRHHGAAGQPGRAGGADGHRSAGKDDRDGTTWDPRQPLLDR